MFVRFCEFVPILFKFKLTLHIAYSAVAVVWARMTSHDPVCASAWLGLLVLCRYLLLYYLIYFLIWHKYIYNRCERLAKIIKSIYFVKMFVAESQSKNEANIFAIVIRREYMGSDFKWQCTYFHQLLLPGKFFYFNVGFRRVSILYSLRQNGERSKWIKKER